TVVWLSPAAVQQHADQPVYGQVRSDTGPRFAAAHPLVNQDGYVLVEADLNSIKIAPAGLTWQLRAASAVSLLWMAGLMSVSVYMLVSYFQERMTRERTEPDVDALKQ